MEGAQSNGPVVTKTSPHRDPSSPVPNREEGRDEDRPGPGTRLPHPEVPMSLNRVNLREARHSPESDRMLSVYHRQRQEQLALQQRILYMEHQQLLARSGLPIFPGSSTDLHDLVRSIPPFAPSIGVLGQHPPRNFASHPSVCLPVRSYDRPRPAQRPPLDWGPPPFHVGSQSEPVLERDAVSEHSPGDRSSVRAGHGESIGINDAKRERDDDGDVAEKKPKREAVEREEPTDVWFAPCRRRGMSKSHNNKTAYFVISESQTKHGDNLECSFPECNKDGPRFRFCAACSAAVATCNFTTRHNHHPDEFKDDVGDGLPLAKKKKANAAKESEETSLPRSIGTKAWAVRQVKAARKNS